MDVREMDYRIDPLEGIGPLRFGMGRQEARAVLGTGFQEFLKDPFDEAPTDAYEDLGLHLYYDGDDRLEAVETFPPARSSYRGEDLLAARYRRVRHLLREGDRRLEVEPGEGLTAPNLGIGAFAPDGEDDPDGPVESVIVFRRGYYDE